MMSVKTSLQTSTQPDTHIAGRRRRRGWLLLVMFGFTATAVVIAVRPVSEPLTPQVIPARVGDAIPGQAIVLLVSFTQDGGTTRPAEVTAAPLSFVDDVEISVSPERIAAGEVAEITVNIDEAVVANLPDDREPLLGQPVPVRSEPDGRERVDPEPGPLGPEGVLVPVRVTLSRGRTVEATDVPINVSPGEDTLFEAAAPLRERFVTWLATERPDLGISSTTRWTPTIVQPHILVVSHYLFFSDEWEMGLMWHIMIPPHDWSRIYLRPRDEMAPTLAFEIPSVGDPASTIREIEVPGSVDR